MTTSQRDALAELRAHRPVAPAEVRDRVRLIAAGQPARPRRFGFTWRRATLVLAPAMVAVVATTIALQRSGGSQQALSGELMRTTSTEKAPPSTRAIDRAAVGGAPAAADVPAPNTKRIQNYEAYLRLRVRDGDAVSEAVKRALAVARSLGGYAASVAVDNGGREGTAMIRLRVPIGRVQEAIEKLSGLGTVVGEQVEIEDVTAEVNAVDRRIARLQRRLRVLRAQPQTDDTKRRIESITREVQRLQRGRQSTIRTARFATISFELTTQEPEPVPQQHHSSRLDGAWTALGWIGIAALYAVIVGAPFAVLAVLAGIGWRIGRRRAEARLLAES